MLPYAPVPPYPLSLEEVMNVLSLFDGISCGRVALERARLDVGRYYASEIDERAMAVSRHNYPDIIQLGEVSKICPHTLPRIDLLLAGSPCQGFSSNGKQGGFDDPRSVLFWEFARILRAVKPTYFLLENVRMKPEWRDIVTEAVGVEPIFINSSTVSAQSRGRYYWTNIPRQGNVPSLGLTLADVLEKPAASTQPMSTKEGKAYCLTATYGNCGNKAGVPYESELVHNLERKQRTCVRLPDGEQWRMLTPKECERLQTLPDDYTAVASDSQRYKMLGNAWTIDVVAYLLRGIA